MSWLSAVRRGRRAAVGMGQTAAGVSADDL
jgi:hypothetical protein